MQTVYPLPKELYQDWKVCEMGVANPLAPSDVPTIVPVPTMLSPSSARLSKT